MPPKKKKGKKSGVKKVSRKSLKLTEDDVEEVIGELSKEFYLIQIRDLETRVNRYQSKCDILEIKNKELQDLFDQQATDKKEIVSFLKKQLEHRADEIADLQERLIGLQQAKDTEKDNYEVQLATLRTEMQEVKDQLTSENMVLGGKLASLEEFRIQREELFAKFAKLEQELVDKEEDHREQIYALEKKSVVDKDRLKKEMILRVNTVAAEFRKVSNKQMAETTKRTLRENVAINSQLAKMSDKTMDLIQENDELREKEKKRDQQTKILEYNETEIMKKNASNQKIIRMLTLKGKELQEQVIQLQKREKELTDSVDRLTAERNDFLELKIKAGFSSEENLRLQEDLQKLEEENAALKSEQENLTVTISHCGQVIKSALQLSSDLPMGDTRDPALIEIARANMLQKLLTMMDLAVEVEEGIDFTYYYKKFRKNGGKTTRNLAEPIKKKARSFPHYQPGDLGLVPSPNLKRLPSLDLPIAKVAPRRIPGNPVHRSKESWQTGNTSASDASDLSPFKASHERSPDTRPKLPAL